MADGIRKEEFLVMVPRYESVPAEDGRGMTSRQLPTTREFVEVSVDFTKLARLLGPKAVLSKGGTAVEAGGLVRVTHKRPRGAVKKGK